MERAVKHAEQRKTLTGAPIHPLPGGVPYRTVSLCPECTAKVEAQVLEKDGKIIMEKTCPEHGTFTATHWQSPAVYNHTEEYDFFKKFPESENAGKFPGCPYTCQDCTSHVSDTVIGVIDVTKQCDLRCVICFSTFSDHIVNYEPTKDELISILTFLSQRNPKPPAILFSGGEPLERRDMHEIIAAVQDWIEHSRDVGRIVLVVARHYHNNFMVIFNRVIDSGADSSPDSAIRRVGNKNGPRAFRFGRGGG